jgi:hypothetical protein
VSPPSLATRAVDRNARGIFLEARDPQLEQQLVLVGRAGLTFSFTGQGSSPMLESQPLVQMVVGRVQVADALT